MRNLSIARVPTCHCSNVFNLGALLSQVGCAQSMRDDNSIKIAHGSFQEAACVFNGLAAVSMHVTCFL